MEMDSVDNKCVRFILIELNHFQSPFFKISNLNTKDKHTSNHAIASSLYLYSSLVFIAGRTSFCHSAYKVSIYCSPRVDATKIFRSFTVTSFRASQFLKCFATRYDGHLRF